MCAADHGPEPTFHLWGKAFLSIPSQELLNQGRVHGERHRQRQVHRSSWRMRLLLSLMFCFNPREWYQARNQTKYKRHKREQASLNGTMQSCINSSLNRFIGQGSRLVRGTVPVLAFELYQWCSRLFFFLP